DGGRALLVEIDGDLAARVADADDEDALAAEGGAGLVGGAVEDPAAEAVVAGPARHDGRAVVARGDGEPGRPEGLGGARAGGEAGRPGAEDERVDHDFAAD